jgi:hypothetical protein
MPGVKNYLFWLALSFSCTEMISFRWAICFSLTCFSWKRIQKLCFLTFSFLTCFNKKKKFEYKFWGYNRHELGLFWEINVKRIVDEQCWDLQLDDPLQRLSERDRRLVAVVEVQRVRQVRRRLQQPVKLKLHHVVLIRNENIA